MNSAMMCGLCVVSLLCSIAWADGDLASDAVAARIERLQRLSAKFTSETIVEPDLLPAAHVAEIQRQTGLVIKAPLPRLVREWEFSRHGDLAEYRTAMSKEAVAQSIAENRGGFARTVAIYTPSRAHTLVYHVGLLNQPHGTIAAALPLPEDSVVDAALGLRPHGSNRWLEADGLKNLQVIRAGADNVVSVRMQDGAGRDHKWVLAAEQGYAPLRYSVTHNAQEILVMECDDFVKVRGVMLPRVVISKAYYRKQGQQHLRQTTTARVESYSLDDESNTPGRYTMMWPKGARVFDQRVGEAIVIVSGDRELDDAAIAKALERKVRVGAQAPQTQPARPTPPRTSTAPDG